MLESCGTCVHEPTVLEGAIASIARVLDGVEARFAHAGSVEASPTAIREACARFTRTWRWHLQLAGSHGRGASNQMLLTIFERAGREFGRDTVQLQQGVASALYAVFRPLRRVPSLKELQDVAAPIILARVRTRVLRGGVDVVVDPVTPGTARRKAQRGQGGRPYGYASGAWANSLPVVGRVVWE